jgi:hypothetical protein
MAQDLSKQCQALYDRTYRVLCDAGLDEKLADELAAQRALAAVAKSRGQPYDEARALHLRYFLHGGAR